MLSPAWHAALRMAVGCLAIFSMSGVIFGVSAIDEFLYASTGLPQSDRAEPASAFAIMASAAFFSADASGALWGELTDRTSALVTLGLSSALSFVSFLLLAAGIRAAARNLITAALVGTGLAGPGILQAVFVGLLRSPVDGEPAWLTAQLGTAIAASFDLSALVLRLPELLSLSSPAGVATFLCVWAFVSLVVAAMTAMLIHHHPAPCEWACMREVEATSSGDGPTKPLTIPSERPPPPPPPQEPPPPPQEAAPPPQEAAPGSKMASAPPIKAPPTEGTALLLDAPEEEAGGVVRSAPSEASGCINDLRALTSVHNVALVAFLCVYVLGSAFYLENHESAFAASFDEDEVRVLNATFDTCFPIGGFVACLLIAPLMCYLRSSSLFLLIALLALLQSSLSFAWSLGAQYVGVALFGPVRSIVWAAFYRLVSDASLYPPHLSGRAVGYACLVSGLVGDGLSPLLVRDAEPDPITHANREPVRIVLLVLLALTALPLPVAIRRAEDRTRTLTPSLA